MSLLLATATGGARSLGDWGIDVGSAKLNLRGWQADTFSFAMTDLDSMAPSPFVYGQEIVLQKDGTVIFIGTIRDLPVLGSSQKEEQKFTAYNFWHALESWIYRQNRSIMNTEFSGLGIVATSQVIMFRDPDSGAKIDNRAEIQRLCTFAFLPSSLGFTGVTPPWVEATDISVATAIRRAAAWQPDLLGHVDYSSGTPVFVVTDSDTVGSFTIGTTAGTAVVSLEGRLRSDLVPLGVWINYITSAVDPSSGLRYYRVVEDLGGSPNGGPYVVINTVNIGDDEVPPVGLAARYFYSIHVPWVEGELVLQALECATNYVPGFLLNFSAGPGSWTAGRAPIIEVQHDFGTGKSTIKFGPPQILPFNSFAALFSNMKKQRPPPAPPEPTGPGVTGGFSTGKAPAGSGGGAGSTAPIDHCSGGTQITTTVHTP